MDDSTASIKRAGDKIRAAMQQARDLERMATFIDAHFHHRVRISSALPHAICVCGAFWEPTGGESSLDERADA